MKDCENYSCGDCKYFRINADRNESLCKRIDHKKIKFYMPWFASYDCGQTMHIVCSDFEPVEWHMYACKTWTCFEDYWRQYKETWLPYGDIGTTLGFMDFINGTMVKNGVLKAVERMYFKHNVNCTTNYELIHEKINGVKIE